MVQQVEVRGEGMQDARFRRDGPLVHLSFGGAVCVFGQLWLICIKKEELVCLLFFLFLP